MRYLIDNYTGKRFYYNKQVTWTLKGKKYNTVARAQDGKPITTLHPTKLLTKDFDRLNKQEGNEHESNPKTN